MDILTLTNHLSREARTRITISLISGWITTIAVIYLYKSNENPLLTIIAAAAGWLFFQSLIPFDFPSHLGHSFLGTSKQLQHVFFIPPSKITTPPTPTTLKTPAPLRLPPPDDQPILYTYHLKTTPPTGPPACA